MKKTLSIVLIAVLTLIMCSTLVSAVTSFTIALSADNTKVEKGKDVELTVALKNFTAGETGINSLYFVLDYDKTVFEKVEATNMTSSNGWSSPTFNPTTGELVTDNSSFMAENHDVLKIKFTVKEKAALGNTVITVKDANASDGVNDIYPLEQKITLTIKDVEKEEPVKNTVNKVENTNTATKNPETGIEDFTIPAILAVTVLGVIAYVRYSRLEK